MELSQESIAQQQRLKSNNFLGMMITPYIFSKILVIMITSSNGNFSTLLAIRVGNQQLPRNNDNTIQILQNTCNHDNVIKWKLFHVTGHLCRELTGPR